MLTRREALLTAGAGLVIAGCGGRPARTIAGDPSDLRILAAALQAEREQVALYEAGVKLSKEPILATILEQERAHAAAIEELIRELGGTPARHAIVRGYGRGGEYDAWRRDAVRAEESWTAGYAAAIPKLANRRLRSTFAALMTSEAEHGAALGLPA